MRLPLASVLALAPVLPACAAPDGSPPVGSATVELLELHAAQRRAHLDEDADAMAALFADGFVEVRDGVVRRPGRAETRARFERYFGAVRFLAWEDLEPPSITLSADGTLATMVVRKLVRLETDDGAGGTLVERTIFAWVATCVRGSDGWRIASVASTRSPEDAAASLAAQRHAVGGEAALERVARVRATYAASGPSGEYALDLDLDPDGPWKLVWRFPGRAPSPYEVHGERGLRFEPPDDVGAPLEPGELAMVRAHAFPLLAWDLARSFPSIERTGVERDADGRTLERLALADELGRPATAWIDLRTDRLARLELRDDRASPPAPVTLVFERWRTVDGVVVPEVVVARDERGAWRLALADVDIE